MTRRGAKLCTKPKYPKFTRVWSAVGDIIFKRKPEASRDASEWERVNA